MHTTSRFHDAEVRLRRWFALCGTSIALLFAAAGARPTNKPMGVREVEGVLVALSHQAEFSAAWGEFCRESCSEISAVWSNGAIPGTSGGGGRSALQLLLTTHEKTSALLVSVVDVGTAHPVSVSIIVLRCEEERWRVVEGNGGLATNEAVRAYVERLLTRPLQSVRAPRLGS